MLTRPHALLVALLAVATASGCEPQKQQTTVPASATTTVISLRDIDCGSCGDTVVAALEKHTGVYDASFDRVAAEISVHYDATQTEPSAMITVVQQQGYTAIEGAGQGAYLAEIEFAPGLDMVKISHAGEAVTLEEHIEPGKVMVFDFYAQWCKPCRQIDLHMKQVLAAHGDVALRKLDVVDWDSELAAQYLEGVPSLPYVVVYGKNGKRIAKISGLELADLDAAIAKGQRP